MKNLMVDNNLMVDIETLGTSCDAVITQIGACYFDRVTGIVGEVFLENCKIHEQIKNGHSIDDETMSWWWKQEEITWLTDQQPLKEVLEKLLVFTIPAQHVWCHATFDVPILDDAIRRYAIPRPWHYTHVRDIRTLSDLAGGSKPITNTKKTHNALEDCLHQVEYCAEYFRRIHFSHIQNNKAP